MTLLRGAGFSCAMLCAGTAVGVAVQLLLARTLGVREYSYYTYASAWLGVLAQVSRLGYDQALVRFLPAYRAKNERQLFRGMLRTSDRHAGLASLLIAMAGLVTVWLLRSTLEPRLAVALSIGLATVPVLSRLGLRQSALRALKCMVGAMCPEALVKQLALVGLVLLASRLGHDFVNSPWMMTANLLATVVALGVADVWLRRVGRGADISVTTADMVHPDQRREWTSVSMSLFAMTLINLVLNQADVMLLGILGDVRQAGQYATAARLASLTGFGLLAVNMILAPMITELHATEKRLAMQRVLTHGARVALLAMLLCGAFMAAAGRTLLGWFGHEFREAYGPLLILLAGHAANTLGGSVGFLMTMTGHERRALAVIGGAAALNLLLHVALIPRFGMLGAAVATAAATLMWNILLVADAWRHLRLDPTSLGRFVAGPPRPRDADPLLAISGVSPCPDQIS